MIPYADTITITRPTTQNRTDTGGFENSGATSVYSGSGDYQEGRRTYRNAQGALVDEGDGTLFLPDASANSVVVGDDVAITFGGDNGSGSGSFNVADISRLDGGITLRLA